MHGKRLARLIGWVAWAGCLTGCQTANVPGSRLSVSLLFNRYTGPTSPSASAFTARPDWPTAPGWLPVQESIEYRQHIVDYQGPNRFGHQDASYRRFSVRREGVAYR